MNPLLFVPIAIVVLYILNSIKILPEYERGVIFRLGRLLAEPKGPGIFLVFAPIDRMVRTSLQQEALEVPPQDIITRDNVTLKVNAVIFLRVVDPRRAIVEVKNYLYQTSQFAQTTLRSVLGEVELDELLSHRDKLNLRIQSILDQHTEPWGVKVANVEVKQVDLPESMLRAMAKQAEAEREKRSKIIHAEGEFSAAQRLVDAAHLLATEPVTIQLRYLQTLTEIGVEKNTTIVFPLPIDVMEGLQSLIEKRIKAKEAPEAGGTGGVVELGVGSWESGVRGYFDPRLLPCALRLARALSLEPRALWECKCRITIRRSRWEQAACWECSSGW